MTAMVERLVRVGVLTPEEGRFLAGDIFNREFRKITDDWVKRPITLTLAGIQTGVEDLRGRGEPGSILDDARKLLRLRDELETEERRLVEQRLGLARRYYAERGEADQLHLAVPRSEFEAWFQTERGGDGAE
jgi:hypothetical protein